MGPDFGCHQGRVPPLLTYFLAIRRTLYKVSILSLKKSSVITSRDYIFLSYQKNNDLWENEGAIHRKDGLETKLCILHLAESSTVESISVYDGGKVAKHMTVEQQQNTILQQSLKQVQGLNKVDYSLVLSVNCNVASAITSCSCCNILVFMPSPNVTYVLNKIGRTNLIIR